jgi:hypothetical protein
MVFPQSNFNEIVESERLLVLTAAERYGEYYNNALNCSLFISQCVTDVAHDRMTFGGFFSLMKKQHILALLSIVRLHKVQAMMNLRQVLEAGAAAAFAIANPDKRHFVKTDKDGILDPSPELSKKRYRWLDDNYTERSKSLKRMKEQINVASSHANIISAHNTFRIDESGESPPHFSMRKMHTSSRRICG